MFSGVLYNCFDSHLHWQASGEFPNRLRLHDLKQQTEAAGLKPQPHHFFGEWLVGYGWDHSAWTEKPHRKYLDIVFPDRPVSFVRCDGHSSWVNTLALKRAHIIDGDGNLIHTQPIGGEIVCDASGKPTGWLLDTAKYIVDRCVPAKSDEQIEKDLLAAQESFLKAGVTHIRDLSCDPAQWKAVKKLDREGKLKIFVDQFYDAEDPADYPKAFELALQAQQDFKNEKFRRVRMGGVKFYSDGSLGSDSAWISGEYPSGGHGLILLEQEQLKKMLSQCWSNNLPVAIHTIGDQAVDFVVQAAAELKTKNIQGLMHLEHVEMARPETVQKMKGLNVRCHLQPSHFLSDRAWLKTKLKDSYKFVFPWAQLQNANVPFYFGSDSPIEPIGLQHTLKAINEAQAAEVASLTGDWLKYHQYGSDINSVNDKTYTRFENGKVVEVIVDGERLIG